MESVSNSVFTWLTPASQRFNAGNSHWQMLQDMDSEEELQRHWPCNNGKSTWWELLFRKPKYHKGKLVDGQWIVGGICRIMKDVFLAICPDNSPLPSNRQYLSCDACLEVKTEDNQNCSVLCCVRQLCTITLRWAVLNSYLDLVLSHWVHFTVRSFFVFVCIYTA